MRIRLARLEEIGRLLEIRRAAFAAQAPAAYSAREVRTLLDDVDPGELRDLAAEARLFVALAGEAVVGCAGWQDDRLRHVYVDPPAMRQGVASRLLVRVEDDYRARTGGGTIRAGVALHALPFYLARGYELVRYSRAWDGSSYAEMVKPLGLSASG
jgi:GNAT superfamily N-acetyltransferase